MRVKDFDDILILSHKKRKQILDILHNPNPPHNQRCWLVGFLRYVGATEDEICELIDKENRWTDYNKKKTRYQVHSVFLSARSKGLMGTISSLLSKSLTAYEEKPAKPKKDDIMELMKVRKWEK